MAKKSDWTKTMMLDLYQYKFKDQLTTQEISDRIGKSKGAISQKLVRVDWDVFIDNPSNYVNQSPQNKKWTQAEMALLYAYMEKGESYGVISGRINRGRIAVERKAQTTDWKAWVATIGDPENPEESTETNSDELTAKLVDALVVLSRRDVDRLKHITESEFRRKINYETDPLPISFTKIKLQVDNVLESLGMKNPEEVHLGEGTYVIVGDSHGKHTKKGMFAFLHQINKTLKPNQIIHLGHLIDDDNDISYDWGKFDNLTIVSKIEELHMVQEQRNKFNFSYSIVRGCITLGEDLLVMNQDLISDYTKTPINSLDAEIFDSKVIVNCHRMELFPKCSEDEEVAYIASPGSLCEKHLVRTIKQINFEDGKHVKQANWTGFQKYRRMRHMYNYWNQGMLVVHIDANGKHTIVPCPIKKIKNNYVTSYFDKIISKTGIHKPTKKIFITADSHSPRHSKEVLDIQEQIVNDYKPDIYVNLGDAADYRTLNHHILDRGGIIIGDIVSDAASVNHVLKRQSTWAKESHIQKGNHERFAHDFIEKFPQLEQLLKFEFLCSVEAMDYNIVDLKRPLKIGSATFIHGDIRLWGQSGSKLEKVSKTFGDCVFMGDSHYPAKRYGTNVIGLTGELDQGYNEPSASTWIQGFGLCNQYKGISFPATLAIIEAECRINGKTYTPKHPENWELKSFKATIVFDEE